MNFTRLIKINLSLLFFLTFVGCGSDSETIEIEENAIINITSGNSIDFGNVIIGVEEIKSFEIKNIGNIDLVINSINTPKDFSTDINSATISPNETLIIEITFKPTEINEAKEELKITSNATSGENTIAILGNGIYNIFEGWKQLSTQEEVNSFGALNYNKMTGFLTIAPLTAPTSSNITDLSPLKSLTSIGGKLALFSNDNLTSLEGLDNLTSVDGDIQLNVLNLKSLVGLKNLSSVGGSIDIVLCENLTSLEGLNNLVGVDGNLHIRNNSNLSSLSGLNNLMNIGGFLGITDNPKLTSIESFDNLSSINGALWIHENDVLTNIEGMNKINSIGSKLMIIDNSALESLSPLKNLVSIGAEMEIRNTGITSLNGLENLNSLVGGLKVTYNNLLTDFCSIKQLIDNSEILENDYTVENNAYNPTFSQIQQNGSNGCEK